MDKINAYNMVVSVYNNFEQIVTWNGTLKRSPSGKFFPRRSFKIATDNHMFCLV